MSAIPAAVVARGRETSGGAPSRPQARRPRALQNLGYVAPTWLLVLAVGLVPTGYAVWMAFTDQGLDSPHPGAFVGFANFSRAVFTPQFFGGLFVTAIYVVCCLVVEFLLGYLLATVLNRQLRGFQLFRTVLLIPMLLTPVVVGLIWQFIFNPDLGVIGSALDLFGLKLNVFADPVLGRMLIIFIDSWMHIPFVMLLLVAGMSGISQEPLEAAAIDGAGWWKSTRYVVLPLLRPVITIILLVRCVDVVRLFDTIYTATQGGPGTSTASVSLLAYQSTFVYFQFGNGAAISVAIAVVMVPVYYFYIRLTKI